MLVIKGFVFLKSLSHSCIDCVMEFKNENGPSKSFLKFSQSGQGLLNSFREIIKNINPTENNNGHMNFDIKPKLLNPYMKAPHVKKRK
tara:strand:- start:1 stop:264 length:264 start_codon:yes stop_codon:yes gene_type:complete